MLLLHMHYIEIEFDEEEEGEVEDEEGIKFLAELLLSGYRWAKETYSDANVHLRVWLAECYGNRGIIYLPCLLYMVF